MQRLGGALRWMAALALATTVFLATGCSTTMNVGGQQQPLFDDRFHLVSVAPQSAEPGEPVVLAFAEATAEKLAETSLMVDGMEIPPGSCPQSESSLMLIAPMIPTGDVEIEARLNGLSCGKATLTVQPCSPTCSVPELSAALEAVGAASIASIHSLLHELADEGVPIDTDSVDADLSELAEVLSDIGDVLIEELQALPAADQAIVLAYLENTGFLSILSALDETMRGLADKTPSALSTANEILIDLDTLSAIITNYALVADAGSIAIAVLSGGAGALPVALAKVFLIFLDTLIDGALPTDLVSARVVSPVTLEEGVTTPLIVEGTFWSEEPTVGASADMIIESFVACIPGGSSVKVLVTTTLAKRLGTRLVEQYLVGPVLPTGGPEDPYYGHVGPHHCNLNLSLYSDLGFAELITRVLPGTSALNTIIGFMRELGDFDVSQAVQLQASAGATIDVDASGDTISFAELGTHDGTLRTFAWSEEIDLVLYSFVWLHFNSDQISFTVELPVVVGPPANLIATPEDSVANLSWSAVDDDGLASYRIYRSDPGEDGFHPEGSVPAGTEKFKDDELTNDATYAYYVTSVDRNGRESEPSNTVEAIPRDVIPPVDDDEYIIGGDVAPDPDDPNTIIITLNAILSREDGTPLTGLTEDNVVVYEDSSRREILSVQETSETTSGADVAFVIDSTGSMGEEIAGVRDSVIEFAEYVESEGVDVWLAGIVFWDYVGSSFDFTASSDDFRDWVSELGAGGGGDGPENDLDAVMEVLDTLSWREGVQHMIVLITDAPMHYAGDGDGIAHYTVQEVTDELTTRGIVLHSISPTGDVTSGLPFLRSATNGQTDTSGLKITLQSYPDASEVAAATGGLAMGLPSHGYLDLTSLPLGDIVTSGYIVKFASEPTDLDHIIRLVVILGGEPVADKEFYGHY